MSSLDFYTGWYCNIWMPRTKEVTKRYCVTSNCHKRKSTWDNSGEFCNSCGKEKKVENLKVELDFSELHENIFGDLPELLFNDQQLEDKDYMTVFNIQDDHIYISESEGEFAMPSSEVHHTWKPLIDYLKKENIKHELIYGIVSCWD